MLPKGDRDDDVSPHVLPENGLIPLQKSNSSSSKPVKKKYSSTKNANINGEPSSASW